MITLPRQARYAMQMMVDLAMQGEGAVVALRHLTEDHRFSQQYAEQISPRPKNAGLLRSRRGRGGGYSLTRDASQMTVLDVLQGMGQECYLAPCVDPENDCERQDRCPTAAMWTEASRMMTEYLSNITLEDLAGSRLS